jgi:hypothetical protein
VNSASFAANPPKPNSEHSNESPPAFSMVIVTVLSSSAQTKAWKTPNGTDERTAYAVRRGHEARIAEQMTMADDSTNGDR